MKFYCKFVSSVAAHTLCYGDSYCGLMIPATVDMIRKLLLSLSLDPKVCTMISWKIFVSKIIFFLSE
jgi:hypothetical protein